MMHISGILETMGYPDCLSAERFLAAEDGAPYDVWKLEFEGKTCVLKRGKAAERNHYAAFLSNGCSFAPALLAAAEIDSDVWLLIEYIPGRDLCHCSRPALILALDALIAMQAASWQPPIACDTFDKFLHGRQNRLKYLKDPSMIAAYQAYLEDFSISARTLCHDDLLPFNVIISEERAVFIDWECCGMLPWATSLARLIAHGCDEEDSLFYMSGVDKAFAIDYYFNNFIYHKGLTYTQYRRSLSLALFYEYCEWVYLGNRYGNTESERYLSYLQKARQAARDLGY